MEELESTSERVEDSLWRLAEIEELTANRIYCPFALSGGSSILRHRANCRNRALARNAENAEVSENGVGTSGRTSGPSGAPQGGSEMQTIRGRGGDTMTRHTRSEGGAPIQRPPLANSYFYPHVEGRLVCLQRAIARLGNYFLGDDLCEAMQRTGEPLDSGRDPQQKLFTRGVDAQISNPRSGPLHTVGVFLITAPVSPPQNTVELQGKRFPQTKPSGVRSPVCSPPCSITSPILLPAHLSPGNEMPLYGAKSANEVTMNLYIATPVVSSMSPLGFFLHQHRCARQIVRENDRFNEYRNLRRPGSQRFGYNYPSVCRQRRRQSRESMLRAQAQGTCPASTLDHWSPEVESRAVAITDLIGAVHGAEASTTESDEGDSGVRKLSRRTWQALAGLWVNNFEKNSEGTIVTSIDPKVLSSVIPSALEMTSTVGERTEKYSVEVTGDTCINRTMTKQLSVVPIYKGRPVYITRRRALVWNLLLAGCSISSLICSVIFSSYLLLIPMIPLALVTSMSCLHVQSDVDLIAEDACLRGCILNLGWSVDESKQVVRLCGRKHNSTINGERPITRTISNREAEDRTPSSTLPGVSDTFEVSITGENASGGHLSGASTWTSPSFYRLMEKRQTQRRMRGFASAAAAPWPPARGPGRSSYCPDEANFTRFEESCDGDILVPIMLERCHFDERRFYAAHYLSSNINNLSLLEHFKRVMTSSKELASLYLISITVYIPILLLFIALLLETLIIWIMNSGLSEPSTFKSLSFYGPLVNIVLLALSLILIPVVARQWARLRAQTYRSLLSFVEFFSIVAANLCAIRMEMNMRVAEERQLADTGIINASQDVSERGREGDSLPCQDGERGRGCSELADGSVTELNDSSTQLRQVQEGVREVVGDATHVNQEAASYRAYMHHAQSALLQIQQVCIGTMVVAPPGAVTVPVSSLSGCDLGEGTTGGVLIDDKVRRGKHVLEPLIIPHCFAGGSDSQAVAFCFNGRLGYQEACMQQADPRACQCIAGCNFFFSTVFREQGGVFECQDAVETLKRRMLVRDPATNRIIVGHCDECTLETDEAIAASVSRLPTDDSSFVRLGDRTVEGFEVVCYGSSNANCYYLRIRNKPTPGSRTDSSGGERRVGDTQQIADSGPIDKGADKYEVARENEHCKKQYFVFHARSLESEIHPTGKNGKERSSPQKVVTQPLLNEKNQDMFYNYCAGTYIPPREVHCSDLVKGHYLAQSETAPSSEVVRPRYFMLLSN